MNNMKSLRMNINFDPGPFHIHLALELAVQALFGGRLCFELVARLPLLLSRTIRFASLFFIRVRTVHIPLKKYLFRSETIDFQNMPRFFNLMRFSWGFHPRLFEEIRCGWDFFRGHFFRHKKPQKMAE